MGQQGVEDTDFVALQKSPLGFSQTNDWTKQKVIQNAIESMEHGTKNSVPQAQTGVSTGGVNTRNRECDQATWTADKHPHPCTRNGHHTAHRASGGGCGLR